MSESVKRKHITDRTKLAAALLARGDVPYEHAKLMHEDQMCSLYHFDHGVLHSANDPDILRGLDIPDIDHFSNLTPRLIREHRDKTKQDIKTIAKSKRLRDSNAIIAAQIREQKELALVKLFNAGINEIPKTMATAAEVVAYDLKRKRKLRSRGFDKTLTRKFSGKVVKREVKND